MRNGVRVGILGLIAAAAIFPGVAVAADFNVNTTADGDDKECAIDCTLREAVVLAGSADRVLVPSGTYVLTGGELSLNGDTIIGDDARKTVIDGDAKSRVLRVIEVTARVSNVTIRNGNGVGLDSGAGGGIFIHSGALLLQNSTVSGNNATTGGGIAAAGVAQLIGVTVSGNRASTGRLTRGGGIITSSTGSLFLGNSTVSGNTAADDVGNASQGGGIYSSGTLAIIASTIAGNSAGEGGGLYSVAPPTGAATSLQNSLLSHGTGGACGGPGIDNLNATFNVASDDSCQLKDPSNLGSVNPQIGALADNGGQTNTHALLPTSPAIHHAGSCATTDQRGFNRVTPCDSGAYEYRAPTLNVVMQVVNDSGGNFNPSRFNVHVRSAAGGDVSGSPQPGSASGTSYTLAAGSTYSVAADALAGYALSVSGDCTAGGSITLQEGQARTCTITANDVAPTLRVITTVVNNNGGSAVAANFSAHVRQNGTEVTGSPKAGSGAPGTLYTLMAGTYAVTADGVSGYAPTGSGACNAAGSVTLGLGQNATCTVTVDDGASKLTVVTQVVNDNGGTAAPSGFTVHVKSGGTDVSGSPQLGSGSGTPYALNAGPYVVSADAVPGYSSTITGACAGDGSITLGVGDDRTCTVTANDDPPVVRAQSSQQLPPPEPGESVNALPKSGTVKVKVPGSAAYVNLDEAQQLPVGTVVDATKGHVTLVAAADDSGGTATAEFWAGIFKLGQTKGKAPTTILTLVEKLSCPKAGKAIAAAKKKKRRLWGDGSGKFRTKGKHSAATVVGTKWLVEDSCKSTLTRVVRGRVSVRDFVKKKTVIVKAGKKYVAKARG